MRRQDTYFPLFWVRGNFAHMTRLARMVVSGLPHHVTQRGNRRESIFFEDGDQEIYRDLLGEQARSAGATVGALGVAVGAAAWDGSSFISNNVITPVFTPDENQSDTINANGDTVPAPDAYDFDQTP